MKHKLLTALLALVSALCLILGISACGGGNSGGGDANPPDHSHTFAATWSSDESGHWHAATCEHTSERKDEAAHTYEKGKCKICDYEHEAHKFVYSDKTEEGHTGTCSTCGKAVTEEHTYQNGVCKDCEYAHQDHHYGTDNTCSVCGAKKPYTKEDGKMSFGEYPQTEVTDANDSDKSLRNSLNMAAGDNPTSSDKGKWTSYGYYTEGKVSDFMWYIDVPYQGNRYRGVYFKRYRSYTTSGSSSSNSYQDSNGYYVYTVYWFKWEPIEWRILEEKDGTALLMANIILDSQQYYHESSGTRTINGKTVYPNNYKESDIRAWLNDTFYETAFDEYAKQIVETTEVDNSASSNSYACETTEDKVFLLSYKNVTNNLYGFGSFLIHDPERRLKSTDYAKAQGIQPTGFNWWLRTPSESGSGSADCVTHDGYAQSNCLVFNTYVGVVPALRIKL